MARRGFAAAAAALMLLGVAGCGDDDDDGGGAANHRGRRRGDHRRQWSHHDWRLGPPASRSSSAPRSPSPAASSSTTTRSTARHAVRHGQDQRGRRRQRPQDVELVIADHKTDPAQVESAAQDVLDQGADVVVTTADYDFGAPAALAARRGRQGVDRRRRRAGVRHVAGSARCTSTSTRARRPRPRDDGRSSPTAPGLRHPYLLEDTSIEYSKSVCERFETAWTKVAGAGTIAGKDTFLNSDPSIASQVSEIKAAATPTWWCCARTRRAAPARSASCAPAGVDLPIFGGAAFDGTFWLEAMPDLSDFYYAAMVSSAGDDPSPAVNEFLSSVILRAVGELRACSATEIIETIARAIERTAATADGAALAEAIEIVQGRAAARRPDDLHAPTATCRSAGRWRCSRSRRASRASSSTRRPRRCPTRPC